MRRYFKKALAGTFAFVIAAGAAVPAAPVKAAGTGRASGEISVNPAERYQTLKGWGTSLCWWGNVIGSWGEQDFNGNGRPDREEIAELAFSPEYLNLNIVRYNVGGGDKENTSIKRCEGLVPGWTQDMTGTRDGSGAFDPETFYSRETEEMGDAGQLWMLEQANAWRESQGDIINEVFANSPPYYMTKSGSSTGGYSWDLNNLREDQYDDFACYLARAVKWIDNDLEKKFGTGVTYVEPINEPDTSYWQDGSTKQEGCIFNTGELQSRAYREMAAALEAEGLSDMQITGTDETALWNAINSFQRLDGDIKEQMTTIGAHTYSGNDGERRELRRIAASYDKDLWMSEVTKGGGSHYDGCHESMDAVNARSQSEGIMSDLKYMQPTAWIAWLVADSEYECLQTDSNWGLLHAVFEKDGPVPDYHTNLVNGDGSKKDWVPGEGYWAVTKQFYTMMQYSKYLKAGYQMVEIGDGNMCAAISPAGDELVIVAQNFGGDRDTSLDLYHVPGAAQALVYRTSDTESCELVETQDVTRGILDMTLPHNSVTTYVVRPSQGQTLCDMENYRKTVDADVVKPEESWTKETDKFTYLGDWGESAEEYGGGKYSTAEEASVTFTFSGTRAAVYGTAAPEGTQAEILVDGELTESVSLAADQKDGSRMLCDTGVLSEGIHTVTIRKAEGQGDRLLEINCAKVITGEFAEEITSVDPCPVVFTASQVRPDLPGQVTVRTNRGNEALRDVQWELDGIDFTRDVTVYGSVEGTTCKASAEVRIAGENIQYFIDCNNPQSSTYAEIDQYAGLLNRVPDQPYADGTWGYLEDYGVYDGDPKDSYDIGWYAFGGQEIAYKVPLKTGTYEVSFGFKEWWPSSCSSRPMSITAETGGDETVLGTSDTWEDGNNWNKDVYTVTCQEEGDVVFRVKKGGGFDPVLSFIQIRHVLELQGLKDALAEAAGIDRSLYDPRQLEQLDETVQEGRALLVGSETTQGQADQTAEEILAIVREPDVNPGVDLKSLQLAAAMAGKLEQEQKENHCFTEESWKAVEESLDRARTILESGSTEISQGEADRVFLDLITACSLLENGVQKVGLKAAIEGARAILADTESLAQYRTESVEAVQKALEAAEQVYNSGISDQETVNRATTELLTAVTSLLVDEEAARLEILIQKAEELLAREEQYTPSTVRKLKEMLEAAKRTAGDSQSTAEQNKEAYDNLAGAMTSLVRKGSKEELKNALEKAGEILADSGRYLEDSIAGLAAVRDEAQAVYDDQEAGGDVIGEVLQKLVREILKARLLGDVDLNGVVDTGDSQILLRVSAELGTLTEEQSQAADVNRDGLADSMDASAILKYASEITDIIR